MPVSERARQFMPFDSLKGLRDALKLKEFKHERIEMGELSEDDIQKISDTLSKISKEDLVEVKYVIDGHIFTASGFAKLKLENNEIKISNEVINLNNIIDISILKKI